MINNFKQISISRKKILTFEFFFLQFGQRRKNKTYCGNANYTQGEECSTLKKLILFIILSTHLKYKCKNLHNLHKKHNSNNSLKNWTFDQKMRIILLFF